MKKLIAFLPVFVTMLNCYSQEGNIGYEQYRSYKMNVYIDNILKELIPDDFNVYYYSGINDKDLIHKAQEYDTVRKEHNVYVYTKKAKDGYLYVNEGLLNHIKTKCYNVNELAIMYLINGGIIGNRKGVFKLLALRKKNIVDIEYIYLPNNVLEVRISIH
jgi:hypothetical protein